MSILGAVVAVLVLLICLGIPIFGLYMMCNPFTCEHGVHEDRTCPWCEESETGL